MRRLCPRVASGNVSVYPVQRHRLDHRHQRLLRAGGSGRAVAVCGGALPGDRHAPAWGPPFSGTLSPPVDVSGQFLWTARYGAGVCLQRDGGPERRAGLPDAVARRHRSAYGLDVERLGWIDHQQHGDRAQHQRKGRCVCVWDHATDPRHLQLLRAVGPAEENGAASRTRGRSSRGPCDLTRGLRLKWPRLISPLTAPGQVLGRR